MPMILRALELDLLKAAFLAHPDAVHAWESWRDSIDWERYIDTEAFSLLPIVQRNLRGLGADDGLFPRFKGIAKQAWIVNQRCFVGLKDSLDECARLGVDLLWLPPAWRWLADPSAVMGGRHPLHWAVRPEQAARAVQSLLRTGWRTPKIRLPSSLIPGYVLGAKHLLLQKEKQSLVLTWGLEGWFGERTADVWRRAVPLFFGNQPVLALERTDALEFALRQPPPNSALSALADVLAIAAGASAIDWNRLDGDLKREPLPMGQAAVLGYLPPFLDAWDAKVDPNQWHAERQPGRPEPPLSASPWVRYGQDWQRYRLAWGAEYRPATALLQLPGYLMARWRLSHPWQLLQGLAGWLRWKSRRSSQPDKA